MSQSTNYYEELLQKYLDNQCNAAEIEELYTWLQSSGAHRSLLAAMQREFEQTMSVRHEVPAELSHRMETRLLQDLGRDKIVALPARKRWNRVIAAAAAILLLIGGTYYFRTASFNQSPSIAGNNAIDDDSADIAPGSNKAILTLANGDEIMLDSAGNQVIRQGKTVVQQRNGQLHYAVKGNADAIAFNMLNVPRGGQFNIVLPDGSHVWLNAASSLRYPTAFNGKERVVEMQGQGYFEVAGNAEQPFIVKVNGMEVQVLGTSFDVMAYPDEKSVNTTLLTGAVSIRHGQAQQLLKPGQQAILNPATGNITVKPADVQQVIAWKSGFFEFDNAHLSDILRQLSRWYDIDIIDNQAGDERLFGGRISRNLPLSEILHMLEANGARFVRSGKKLMVTSGN